MIPVVMHLLDELHAAEASLAFTLVKDVRPTQLVARSAGGETLGGGGEGGVELPPFIDLLLDDVADEPGGGGGGEADDKDAVSPATAAAHRDDRRDKDEGGASTTPTSTATASPGGQPSAVASASADATPEDWHRFEAPRGAAVAIAPLTATTVLADPFSPPGGVLQRAASLPAPEGGGDEYLGRGKGGFVSEASAERGAGGGGGWGGGGGGGTASSYPLQNPFLASTPPAAAAARVPNMDHRKFEDLMKHLADA